MCFTFPTKYRMYVLQKLKEWFPPFSSPLLTLYPNKGNAILSFPSSFFSSIPFHPNIWWMFELFAIWSNDQTLRDKESICKIIFWWKEYISKHKSRWQESEEWFWSYLGGGRESERINLELLWCWWGCHHSFELLHCG